MLNIQNRLFWLLIIVLFISIGLYAKYKIDRATYIYFEEYHLYNIKTPIGDLKKETKSKKQFNAETLDPERFFGMVEKKQG